jgi:hypothetical protein
MSEPSAYNKGLGSLFNFKDKLKQPRKFGRKGVVSFGGSVGPPPPPPPIPPPLDTFNQNLVGAYSLRKLSSSYSGPAITIANNAGASFQVGFNAAGDLNTAAMQTWMNANLPGPFRVYIWHNQMASLTNNFQSVFGPADSVKMPAIADTSGNIYTSNGKPCIKFGINNLPTWLSRSFVNTNAKYMVLSDLAQQASNQAIVHSPSSQTSFGGTVRGSIIYGTTGLGIEASEFSPTAQNRSFTVTLPPSISLIHSQYNTTLNVTNIYYNGVLMANDFTGVLQDGVGITNMHIGNLASGDSFSGFSSLNYFNGNMQEIIMYSQAQEIYISGLTANIMQYWGL